MKLCQEDKDKIKLIVKIFNAQSVFIDGIRCNLPKNNTVVDLLENDKNK